MSADCFYPSLTRISPLNGAAWSPEPVPRGNWETGDYVLCEAEVGGHDQLELASGRMVRIVTGDRFIGVLGEREATLEATGSWRGVGEDGTMDVLTSAGLVGKLTSKSPYLPSLIRAQYHGHVHLDGHKATMSRFAHTAGERPFAIPTVLMVGTSMSSGKTTAGQVVVRQLRKQGCRVLAAKLTGAGRYRDILHMADAGAEWIYDFVDAGLPSTVVPEDAYRPVLRGLLSMISAEEADAAVIEIGASPLAAYNGMAALAAVWETVRFTVLAASDVYAVLGFQQLVGVTPDLVVGPTANTSAGVKLVAEHTGLTALNLMDPEAAPKLDALLAEAFGLRR
jgi:hypothetical protein